MRKIFVAAAAAALASTAIAAPVGVRVTGNSQADSELMKDILQTVTYYGAALDCPAPTTVRMSIIPPSRVSASADYRAPSEKASYEEWKADFCGKQEAFFVSFWPDPNGGSFLKVAWPYPDGAPHGGR